MGIKEDIIEILLAVYKVPGEFAIAGIIAFAFWNAMKDLTGWSFIFLILGIFFVILEILSPFLVGLRLYKNIFK